MNENNDVAEVELQTQDEAYLPCVHQRIAARLIQHSQSEEKRQELVELSATWQD